MPTRRAIAEIYQQVQAPEWAGTNLDALADVLRDLSWLPDAPVVLAVPDLRGLDEDERARFLGVLWQSSADTADGPRPVSWNITC